MGSAQKTQYHHAHQSSRRTTRGEAVLVFRDHQDWRTTLLERDLPAAYLMLRLTMGFHMFAHGGVRLPILTEFASQTVTEFAPVRLIGLPFFPAWFVYPFAMSVPVVEFLVGVLLILGFKTKLASLAGGVTLLLLMFGQVARANFGTAHLMWFYVLIFATLVALNFADRYSVDRMREPAGGQRASDETASPVRR
jgi:thiosulfate dehydrogenase [quinone] large subunit